jgi:predicted RNA-binding Zn-ribbon protein involved in translation (DUF1610 family)
MAKKPAKRNITNTTVPVVKVDDGYQVLYIGASKSVHHTCPECGKITGKGMIRQYKEDMYCSRRCVQSFKNRLEPVTI